MTLAEISRPIAAEAFPRTAKMIATMNSGASDASGASHCTSRNWSTPSSCPDATSASANGSADAMITAADSTNIVITTLRRRPVGSAPIPAAGPTRSGSASFALPATRTR